MSKLTKWTRSAAKAVYGALPVSHTSKYAKSAEKAISNVVPHQHAADRRAANQAVAEQISFYKEQKQELHDQAAAAKEEKNQERNKIQEKQIRSLRRAYRKPGFLDQASPEGLSDTLG